MMEKYMILMIGTLAWAPHQGPWIKAYFLFNARRSGGHFLNRKNLRRRGATS